MRIFLGIKLPEKTKNIIRETIKPLQKEYPTALWVPSANYHVTLCFIGEVIDHKRLIPKIETVLFDLAPFHLELNTGRIFQRDTLTLIIECYRQKELERKAEELNISLLRRKPEHQYLPHITFARARNPSKQQYTHLKKKVELLEFDHSFKVEEITLYKSEQQRGGIPRYEELETFKLPE